MSSYGDHLRAVTAPSAPYAAEDVCSTPKAAEIGAQGVCEWCDAELPEHITGCRLGQSSVEQWVMWDEEDEKYGRKVSYWAEGFERTAYLDKWLGGSLYQGTEKHTDTPVTVQWTGQRYEEVWMCPECNDYYGPEDEDKPPLCDMCLKASGGKDV